jgi:membrane protein DedA with SNARE-associated domain
MRILHATLITMLSSLIAPFISYLHELSTITPLPWFIAVGAFIEEVIAPIPSPLVMTLGGSLAASSNQAFIYLFWLALIGSVAKTGASYIVYVISDKAEDLVLNKLGRFIGVSHKDVEKIGSQLSGGWRDDVVMLLLRAVPIIPTAPVSVVSGLLKINLRTFFWTTLIGYAIRNFFYLYLGFTSVGALDKVNEGLDSFETIGYLIVAGILLALVYYFYKQRQDENILQKLLRFFHLK